MILGSVSYLDCLVFLVFLAPQLIIHVGLFKTAAWVLGAVPFLAIQLPYLFVKERFFTRYHARSPFVQKATVFQDIVIRCVRYAFACMPAYIGRVFFSRPVSLPFMYFRMLRHGYLSSPIPWIEVNKAGLKGVWIISDPVQKPDIVIYYCHGGGFSMGSSYFYLEFLLAWVTLLKEAGYRNPALFSLEYTLVPDACYPTQIQQAFAGYDYVLSIVDRSDQICVAGDSAGATLILSLLLYMGDHPGYQSRLPGLAILISPWVTLVSENNRNTPSDYLDADSLELYGRQYAGDKVSLHDPLVSPGECKEILWWARATPFNGWYFHFGSEEVLAPETKKLIALLRKANVEVDFVEEQGRIHCWPVASLYLGGTKEERLHDIKGLVDVIKARMDGHFTA